MGGPPRHRISTAQLTHTGARYRQIDRVKHIDGLKICVFYTGMPKKKKPQKRRGNPIFNFRLEKPRADKFRLIAKIFGAPNASVFAREMIGCLIDGTPDELRSYLPATGGVGQGDDGANASGCCS